jgi:hypothetical protein
MLNEGLAILTPDWIRRKEELTRISPRESGEIDLEYDV